MKIKSISLRRPPRYHRKRVRIIRAPIKVSIKKENVKKGIYIIPSLFTCANMALGIFSVFSSIEGDFIQAAWFLIAALACDILDGRIARMTKTTSEFGMQLDSLSDLVSFGIAPAVMMYIMVLKAMGNTGVAIAVLFILCSALRLARFNVLAHDSHDSQSSRGGEIRKYFTGLPTPASAGVIISFVLSYQLLVPSESSPNFKTIPAFAEFIQKFFEIMPVVMVVLSFLMVSNVPYLSFKKIKLSKVRTIELMVLLIVVIILIVVYPQNIIFLIFSGYAASGLLLYLPKTILNNTKNKQNNFELKEEEENDM